MILRGTHAEAGAVLGSLGGIEIVSHYGDRQAEEVAIRRGAAVIDRTDLAHFRLGGRDPVRMVNGLITNDLRGATDERAVYAAMLTPKGRTIADLRALVLNGDKGTEVLLDVPRVAAEDLSAHLRKYVPPMFARWAAVEDIGVLGVYGPEAVSLVASVLGVSPDPEEDRVTSGSFAGEHVLAIGTRLSGGEGLDLILPDVVREAMWAALIAQGGTPVGMEALEDLRVEAGRPRFGAEITAETIPAEAFETTGLMERAISFTKGCYTGQEVVVRIAHRGHVNRHVRGLVLAGAPAVEERAAIHRPGEEKQVGWITTVARPSDRTRTVALGVLRREVSVGQEVRVGGPDGVSAIVTSLPIPRD